MKRITVGPGGDYTDIRLAIEQITTETTAHGGAADDYLVEIIGNCTCDALGTTGQVCLDGHTLTIVCPYNRDHPLDWQNWYQIQMTGVGQNPQGLVVYSTVLGVGQRSTGIIRYDSLYFNNLRTSHPGVYCSLLYTHVQGRMAIFTAGTPADVYIKNCLFDGNDMVSTGVHHWRAPVYPGSIHLYNCKLWNCREECFYPEPSISEYDLGLIAENCTFYQPARVGGHNSCVSLRETCTLRNCVAAFDAGVGGPLDGFRVTSAGFFVPSVRYENCAASDDIHDGAAPPVPIVRVDCIDNIVLADEFISVDDTNPKFLYLRNSPGTRECVAAANPLRGNAPLSVNFSSNLVIERPGAGQLAAAGRATSYATTDIEGLPRPGEDGQYSIGAHEFQYEWTNVVV